MPIIRWNPFTIDKFFDEDWDVPTIPGLSRLMGQGLNLYEDENSIVAEMAMPGIPEKNIDITFEDGVVRVVGSKEEKSMDRRKKYISTLSSSYNYSFRLPQEILKDEEPVFELQDGVLVATFSKMEKIAPKKFKVTKKPSQKIRIE